MRESGSLTGVSGWNGRPFFLRTRGFKQDHEKAVGSDRNHGEHTADCADHKQRFQQPYKKHDNRVHSAGIYRENGTRDNYPLG